jgi:CBS-domain-containing membrane protein
MFSQVERPAYPLLGATFLLVVIGAIGVATGWPWLVPSLGAAAFVQTMTPDQPSARPWHVVMGQLCGLAGGYAGVYAVGAEALPALESGHPLVWLRVAAVAIAVAVTVLLMFAIDGKNPAGGATTLLIALGTEPQTWRGAVIMVVGILLVSALGEATRFLILRLRSQAAAPPSVRRKGEAESMS